MYIYCCFWVICIYVYSRIWKCILFMVMLLLYKKHLWGATFSYHHYVNHILLTTMRASAIFYYALNTANFSKYNKFRCQMNLMLKMFSLRTSTKRKYDLPVCIMRKRVEKCIRYNVCFFFRSLNSYYYTLCLAVRFE